jgi:hypothetical protein
LSNPASKDNFAHYRLDTIAYNYNLLYSKDFYTARNFLNKNFQVLQIREGILARKIAMGDENSSKTTFFEAERLLQIKVYIMRLMIIDFTMEALIIRALFIRSYEV